MSPRSSMFASLRKLHALSSRRDRVRLLALSAMMLVAALLEVVGVGAIPAFVMVVVDPEAAMVRSEVSAVLERVGPLQSNEFVGWAVAALLAVFAAKNGFLVLFYYYQTRYVANRRTELARRLMGAYIHAPYPFHLERNTAELMRNVERETSIIAHQVLAALLEVCTRILILLAVLAFLLVVEPWVTLGWLVVFGAAAVYGVTALSAKLEAYGREEQRFRGSVLQALNQGFGSIKESRVLHRESFFANIVGESVRRMSDSIRFKQFTGAAMAPLTEFIAVAGLFVVAAVLVVLGRPPESILVTLSLFVVGLVRLREAVSAGMTHLANLRYSAVSVDPVYADLTALEEGARARSREEPAAAPLPVRDAIELDDVHYRYAGAEAYALRGVSLRVPAGAAVGIVGGSGAGKSTLVDLVLGLLEPERGSVRVDGADVRGDLRAWQANVGYVPQTIYLLDDTIRANIALGCTEDEVDEEAVRAAVRAAQIEELVDRLPDRLDTRVGERGARLSGGERQRIGIARALYRDPQVLVLDEAMSALDNTTERAVIEAVGALKGERTVIMIAHRLGTVKSCDVLYFLRAGELRGAGSFGELEAANDEFRRMASST